MGKLISLSVVGMLHRVTPATLEKIAQDTPLHCRLEREPENSHDENAIKVVIVEKPWRKQHDGLHVGFIPRGVAKDLAPRMDAGKFQVEVCWLILVNAKDGTGELSVELPPAKKAKENAGKIAS